MTSLRQALRQAQDTAQGTAWTEDPYLFRWATSMVRVAILTAAMSTLAGVRTPLLRSEALVSAPSSSPSSGSPKESGVLRTGHRPVGHPGDPRAAADSPQGTNVNRRGPGAPGPAPGPRVGRPVGPGLPPEVEQWSRKAVRGYQEAQEKKWRRWAEAMFGPETEGRR